MPAVHRPRLTRPAECVYHKSWLPSLSNGSGAPRPGRLSAQDDAKLIFGTVFSLRNMVRKLGGQEDKYGPTLRPPRVGR